jgi:protease IV
MENDDDTDITESAPIPPRRPRPVRRKKSRKRATVVLLAITMLGLAVFVSSIGVVAYLLANEDLGEVADGSFLEVKLSGILQDAPKAGGLFVDPEMVPPLVTEVSDAIRAAADDERINGIFLELDNPVMGFGSNHEIRSSLVAFREAGKPCVAYSENYSNGTWYLASACDQVVVAPSGAVMTLGLNASITYYAGLFEKIGVDPEMLHVGDFKSAIEPYERSGPSEPAAEALNLLLDGIYDNFVTDIATSRGVSPDEVRGWVDEPSLVPVDAIAEGMIDGKGYRDVVRGRVHEVAAAEDWVSLLAEPLPERADDEDAPSFTKLMEYVKSRRHELSGKDENIAVVYAEGAIVSGDDEGGLFGDSGVLADRPFARWMKEVREDDSIKAVVLRVNSPGGSGLASDMMWHEIKLTQAAGKKVVVSMNDYAASGGYFIAAPADYIIAQPTTITGSIGVFGGKFNLGGTYEKLGLTTADFKRGEQSHLLSPTSSFGEEGTKTMQRYLDSFYWEFVDKVSIGRSMERDAVHEVAQGRVWTGIQAKERGLVDGLGGLDVALAKAAELGAVSDYGIIRLPRQKTFVELLMEDLQGEAGASLTIDMGIPLIDEQAMHDLMLLDRILSEGGAAVMLPGNLTVE